MREEENSATETNLTPGAEPDKKSRSRLKDNAVKKVAGLLKNGIKEVGKRKHLSEVVALQVNI